MLVWGVFGCVIWWMVGCRMVLLLLSLFMMLLLLSYVWVLFVFVSRWFLSCFVLVIGSIGRIVCLFLGGRFGRSVS